MSEMQYVVRDIEPRDYERVLEIYAPYVRDTAVSFEYDVPTQEEFNQRIAAICAQFPYLVCEYQGRVIGYAYAHKAFERAAYGWDAETTVYLDLKMTHKGAGAALYEALIPILQKQHIAKLYALISGQNMRSRNFHEKFGFTLVATMKDTGFKFGRWHDMCWYERDLIDHANAPQLFVPYNRIKDSNTQRG